MRETLKGEKQHDTVDKSTSKQQVCVSDGIFLCRAKNWTHTPSASGSYSRQAGQESLVVFKCYNSTSNAFFRYLNRFSDYFTLYQQING